MIIFDIETNGLNPTKIHCLSYTYPDTLDVKTLFDYDDMRNLLVKQSHITGHNIVRYDVPVLERLLGIELNCSYYDTLPMSWVMNTDRPKHGLASFGEDFGIPKPVIEDWKGLTQEEYAHRCEEDVKINYHLWQDLIFKFRRVYEQDKLLLNKYLQYLTYKMQCAATAEQQGWRLDVDLAERCVTDLTSQQDQKIAELVDVMPMNKIYKVAIKPKKYTKEDGSVSKLGHKWDALLEEYGMPKGYEGELKVVKGVEPANPKSSDQVKDWLYSMGWKPCTHKYVKEEDGSERRIPQVRKDGELTRSVQLLVEQDKAVAVLDGLTVIQHRLAIFKGFLECQVGGFVKAEIAGLTNTLRFKHSKPLVNLPGVDKPWGKEVRGCLVAPDDNHTLCGADMTSLEDTTKRHYMQPYDPDYVKEMSKDGFDPHLDLALHSGAITQKQIDMHNSGEKSLKTLRKNYKVVNYSATYGVGAAKLSRETGMSVGQAGSLLTAYWERNKAVTEFVDDQPVRYIGGQMWVQNPVSKFWHTLRFKKDVFSTLNQSTGAYCFDRWVYNYRSERPNLIGQFHDETINVVKKGDEALHTETLQDAIKMLNKHLQLNVDLGIDVQYGATYADIH
tara:strand:+ start:1094 stop:2938 length:1845 start_codon:yes stop_codon:yes gene_type:complete